MIALILVMTASAAKTVVVSAQVTNPEGLPIPAAYVRFDDEGERHRVNTFNGRWEGDMLYLPDSSARPFTVGTTVGFWATAAGYEGRHVDLVVSAKKKENHAAVTLTPLARPDLACWGELTPQPENGRAIAEAARVSLQTATGEDARGCAMAAGAWGLALEVLRLENEYVVRPTDELHGARFAATKDALEATRAWREWLAAAGKDPGVTVPLCVSLAGTDALCR